MAESDEKNVRKLEIDRIPVAVEHRMGTLTDHVGQGPFEVIEWDAGFQSEEDVVGMVRFVPSSELSRVQAIHCASASDSGPGFPTSRSFVRMNSDFQ